LHSFEGGIVKYEHYDQLQDLISRKLVSRRPHPSLPLEILNYTPAVMSIPINEWSEALQDCRGLILEQFTGEVVGRPFRKFWNYEQVLDKIPNEPFEVWEKLDGSLGILCSYDGNVVVATRGSFESEQAFFAMNWIADQIREGHRWFPPEGYSYLVEIIYPQNRIVVDYKDLAELVLLSVMDREGKEDWHLFDSSTIFTKAKRINWNFRDPAALAQMERYHPGEEGFVVRWRNGFRAKVKFEEYKRLHRLITQVSTRSIWELLRSGKETSEIQDRVPEDFRKWVQAQHADLIISFDEIFSWALNTFSTGPLMANRKIFAEWAKQQKYPNLLFAQLDQKSIKDMIWRMLEPKWNTPFRKEQEL
jgi:RNA ligase